MNFANVEYELNRMKAEALGDAGRKLELLSAMIEREKSYQGRSSKIITRILTMLSGKLKRKKRSKLMQVRVKLEKKMAKSASALRNMEKHKEELYKNLIMQREALGLTDHEWIDKFYMNL